MLPVGEDRRTEPFCARFDDVKRRVALASDDDRHAALDDARLFGGDIGQRVAEELLVVHVHGRDHREARGLDDIGRVQPPAKADLQQRHVGGGFRERRRRRRLW